MKIFLKDIAGDLLKNYGNDIADHCVVFPSKRSILFFRKYLSELIDKPLFMPSLQTISSLLSRQSTLKQAEALKLVYELYNVYLEAGNPKESFDEFYHWGEMLLADFNDVDKYLVDPDMLFTNLADLKEIDRKFGGLDEDIIAVIRQFWTNFEISKMTGEKSDFLNVWETLPSVYNNFTGRLRSKGLAYEGMITREQTNRVKENPTTWYEEIRVFHFVGFNALNKCEKTILGELKKAGRAKFYWDYDPSYVDTKDHEAGYFIRQNINELPSQKYYGPGNKRYCSVSVYSAPSDVAQAKIIPSLLKEYEAGDDPNDTAIVLADENLLLPVLNSLPEKISKINVTMGFPLYHTPVYSLVHQLLNLQKNRQGRDADITFYYNDVVNVLQHQYVAFNFPADSGSVISDIREKNLLRISRESLLLNELFELIFSDTFNNRTYLQAVLSYAAGLFEEKGSAHLPEASVNDGGDRVSNSGSGTTARPSRLNLQQEYIYNLVLPLNQLSRIMEENGMELGIDLYARLTDRIMRQVVIPFSGEPLQGLQVMGILETRSLDFKNIVFLSANEGKIPKPPPANSYIPYNLREAFGLPTVKHSDSIYAYYFYRLLHRSEKVNFVYNNSTEGLRSGEMSRFLLQLKYDKTYDVSFIDTRFNILPAARVKDVIRRTPEINQHIHSLYLDDNSSKYLSPSGINTWINCRMKFYYRYVAGIKESEDVLEEVDALAFGNILHHVMKEIYEPYTGKMLDGQELKKMLAQKDFMGKMVEKAFRKVFMKGNPGPVRGKNLVITSIIEKMTSQIIEADSKYAPFEIVSLEKYYHGSLPCLVKGVSMTIPLGGAIDRVDRSGKLCRILDYKSGADSVEIRSIDDLFDYDSKDRNGAAFQTLLYCELFARDSASTDIRPSLYPVRKIFSEDFSDVFRIKNGPGTGDLLSYAGVRDHFIAGLEKVLSDIFDPDVDFVMTDDQQKCTYCPYKQLCNRKGRNSI
jgi:CRISPR/Cas system-associated exonuclease Cas4 (RecB family)